MIEIEILIQCLHGIKFLNQNLDNFAPCKQIIIEFEAYLESKRKIRLKSLMIDYQFVTFDIVAYIYPNCTHCAN